MNEIVEYLDKTGHTVLANPARDVGTFLLYLEKLLHPILEDPDDSLLR